jgi:ABC-type transporter lipoprotein component MlaA
MAWRLFHSALVCLAAILLLTRPVLAQPSLDQFNGWAYEVNRILDRAIIRPGMEGYRQMVPDRAKVWVGHAYRNLTEPVTATAHAIDGDGRGASVSTFRFVVNSTLGLGGVIDFAGRMGVPRQEKTFTEAVCGSGLPLGGFVILPVIGPTTTGVAVAAAGLMLGSTLALGLISIELAAASMAIDVIGSAAALEGTLAGANIGASYEEERDRLAAALRRECGAAAAL